LHVGYYASAGGAYFFGDLENFLPTLAHNEITISDPTFRGKNYAVFTDYADGCGAG
jgi:hypothetical protein